MIRTVVKFAASSALAFGLLGGTLGVASAQLDLSGSGQCAAQGGCVGDSPLAESSREIRRDRDDNRREIRRDRNRDDNRGEVRRGRDRDRGENRRESRRDRDRDRRSDYRDRRNYRDYGRSYYRDPYYGSPSVVFEYSRPVYRSVAPSMCVRALTQHPISTGASLVIVRIAPRIIRSSLIVVRAARAIRLTADRQKA